MRGRSLLFTCSVLFAVPVGATDLFDDGAYAVHSAASGPSSWAKTYNRSEDDIVSKVSSTPDGGSIVVAHSLAPRYRFWVFKLDSSGNVEWEKYYGDVNRDHNVHAVRATDDGGYVVAGLRFRGAGGGQVDIWVLRLDGLGDIVWQKTYSASDGSQAYDETDAYSIYPTCDHGFVVAGFSRRDQFRPGIEPVILKLDADGNVDWAKTYRFGGSGVTNSGAFDVVQTDNGGYAVAGFTDAEGAGEQDFWVLRLDPSGGIEWQKAYGGPRPEWARSILPTQDQGYLVAGYTNSFGAGSSDVWVLRLDTAGTVLWQKTYGGPGQETGLSLSATADGRYIHAGITFSFGSNRGDAWVFKFDDNGSIQWQKRYGGPLYSGAVSVHSATDGNYVVAAETFSFREDRRRSVWILKLDSEGQIGLNCSAIRDTWAQSMDSPGLETATDATTVDLPIVSNSTFSPGVDSSATVNSQCTAE
jgi:hypothetical protein